ncbi:PA2928 family protein [Dokdonella sp.]|uniref:PA2928 family protein n=1 Tax=Dokdonella sp. TaxID=2291710 RepID=UPI003C698B97
MFLVGLAALGWLFLRGSDSASLAAGFGFGPGQGLQPALFQSMPLRATHADVDRIYLVSTQSQTLYLATGRGGNRIRTDYLHVDLWALDAATATVAWRKRMRSFKGREREGRILPGFRILGVDGKTLWLDLDGPLGIALDDGHVVADSARIEQRNPMLAGKLLFDPGYVAFGRNGLQLTLDDASQWRIDAADLSAAPRDTPVSRPDSIVPPANSLPSATSQFQIRGLRIGEYWLGVLTDAEADQLSKPPVVPGHEPNERPGVMQQFLNENHVPTPINDPLPQPYRLWRARTKEVSAAPPDWPKELPDNWGTRTAFSDYAALPDSPTLLRAGLLRGNRDADVPFWYRDPDSVLVLHTDRLGPAGRLQLSRISGPLGKRVWNTPLPMVSLSSVMRGENDLVLWGSEPASADVQREENGVAHAKLVRVDVATGQSIVLDLTAEGFTREALETGMPP